MSFEFTVIRLEARINRIESITHAHGRVVTRKGDCKVWDCPMRRVMCERCGEQFLFS